MNHIEEGIEAVQEEVTVIREEVTVIREEVTVIREEVTVIREEVTIIREKSMIVGEYHYMSYQPTPIQLAKWRYLELKYQIIEIALYQELCGIKWVGAANNATADWWYKCDENGTRNINGLWMRVEDARGMFYRGAGANAVNKGANNTPYDCGDIGSVITDAIRNITGQWASGWNSAFLPIINTSGAVYGKVQDGWFGQFSMGVQSTQSSTGMFDASRAVPTAHENRPASIAKLVCISY